MENSQNNSFGWQPGTAPATAQPAATQPTTPVFNAGGNIPGLNNQGPSMANAAPQDRSRMLMIIIIIVTSLLAVAFIGLFIWILVQYEEIKTDIDGQIDAEVAQAVKENTDKLEEDFAEREKSPYNTFAGPSDYGELTFSYPKTWNVYEAADASNGGDYEAYFNPDKVPPINDDIIYALRVYITSDSYEDVVEDYNGDVEDGELSVNVRQINGVNANVYEGKISDNINGIFAVIKIRDKTAIIRTDASGVFRDDFNAILDSIQYNS